MCEIYALECERFSFEVRNRHCPRREKRLKKRSSVIREKDARATIVSNPARRVEDHPLLVPVLDECTSIRERSERNRYWRKRKRVGLAVADEAVIADPVRETIIMVLPFDDLSPTKENAYFAAGMYEDVLHKVASIPGLPVIARHTAMKFSGTSKSPRDIGTELGITHLLTGTIRRAGDRLRINVYLISTDNEQQLWSGSYDKQMDDIFAIQSDVAIQIANEMQFNIDEAVTIRLVTKPTDNLVAYDLYLKGRELERLGTTAGVAESISLASLTLI